MPRQVPLNRVFPIFSLLQSNSKATVEDIEHILDGNLCRCTGYRPIFDAFKTFSVEVPENLKSKLSNFENLQSKLSDIEDLAKGKNKICCKAEKTCSTG
jgi:xanthine dehydrogenase/oxidase